MPALQPNPFGAGHVQQGPEDRLVTYANIAAKIFVGQLCRGVHRQAVSPFGVVKKVSDV